MNNTTYIFLAGYGNSTGEHWQAKWFNSFPNSIWVEQGNWEQPARDEWVSAIELALNKVPEPAVVISHSLGGLAFVEWAKRYPEHLQQKIRAACLVAIPDANAESFPAVIQGFSSTPTETLLVPTLMLSSANDPYCSVERSEYFARMWGSELRCIGAKGHINTQAGLGDWPEGERYLQDFLTSIG